MTRTFQAKPAVRGTEPLLIGMVGPPGGGKTFSALRMARGMKAVRPQGDIVLIDTEGGRSRKYAGEFDFLHVAFDPPHRPEDFLDAISQQIQRACCVIIDSMSDEHEGVGGYLDWHDEMVGKVGGNEWAAWAKPSASRKKLIRGLLQIKVPLIFTFRAREKTRQQPNARGKIEIVNIGWMPVAPLEIVHTLDLTCILPPRADGVPVWESSKIGEDFIIKLPGFLKHCIGNGQLDETTGKALAQWAAGTVNSRAGATPTLAPSTKPVASPGSAAHGQNSGFDSRDGSQISAKAADAGQAETPAPSPTSQATPGGAGDPSEVLMEWDARLAKAAGSGTEELQLAWDNVPAELRKSLKVALDRRHKPRAAEVDARDRS